MVILKNLLWSLLIMAWITPGALAEERAPDLPNFRMVVPQSLYRGGQPSPAGLRTLVEEYNVKIIIDLRSENPELVKEEMLLGRSLGIKILAFPMSAFKKPSDKTINQIEAILETANSNQPVYVHCLHGQDRTGLVMGLFRVLDQKENPQKAYEEMLADGFHPVYVELREYFCKRTNYCP